MARDINDIQRDLDQSRRRLATTLDELAERTKPQRLVDDAKRSVTEKLQDPQVQKVIAGVAAGVVVLVAIGIASSRKKNKNLKELQKLLAQR